MSCISIFLRNRLISFLCVLCLLLPMLLSCGNPAADGDPFYLRFTDSTGEEVILKDRPVRVAVLFSSFAEMWQLAGGEVAVTVGESVERGFCPVDTALVDSGAGKTVNAELLIANRPDLVICSADIAAQNEISGILRDAGIPVARFRVESFSDYLSVLKIMTDITGNAEAYETNGLSVSREADTVKAIYGKRTAGSILFLRVGSSARSTKAKDASGHFAASMLEELGCFNIADRAPILLDGISMETILTENPYRIFVTTMGDEDAARSYLASLLESDAWQALSAVREGRVEILPKELFQFKPNARWGEAYRYLAEILYETDPTTENR